MLGSSFGDSFDSRRMTAKEGCAHKRGSSLRGFNIGSAQCGGEEGKEIQETKHGLIGSVVHARRWWFCTEDFWPVFCYAIGAGRSPLMIPVVS